MDMDIGYPHMDMGYGTIWTCLTYSSHIAYDHAHTDDIFYLYAAVYHQRPCLLKSTTPPSSTFGGGEGRQRPSGGGAEAKPRRRQLESRMPSITSYFANKGFTLNYTHLRYYAICEILTGCDTYSEAGKRQFQQGLLYVHGIGTDAVQQLLPCARQPGS
eukprot:3918331-Pleurochrysis_carterae.AAC.1